MSPNAWLALTAACVGATRYLEPGFREQTQAAFSTYLEALLATPVFYPFMFKYHLFKYHLPAPSLFMDSVGR